MKKKALLLLTLLAGTLCSQADNTVSVSQALVPQGKTGCFNIELDNDDEFVAFQMRLTLPEGITFVSASKSDRYADNPGVGTNGQTTTFTMFSPVNAPITGNSGALLTITVSADAGIEAGTKLTATLWNMEFGRKDESYIRPEAIEFDIEITDKVVLDENSTAAPAEQDGVDVLVKRTIKKDVWSTIVLPFTLTQAKAKAAFGDDVQLAEFKGFETDYGEDEENVTPLGITINFATYTLGARKSMTGGKPFLIKTSKDIESFEVENVKISNTVSDVTVTDEWDTPGRMTGSLVATTIPEDGLFISDNKFWYSVGKTRTKAFRCWFELDAVLDKETAFESRIHWNIVDDVTTGIGDNVGIERGKNGTIVYDLQGRRIEKPAKGLYVKDGHKVVIK